MPLPSILGISQKMKSFSRVAVSTVLFGSLTGCAQSLDTDMGRRLEKEGDLAGAIAQYRQAVQDKPSSAPSHLTLGRALLKSGDVRGAEAEFREAVRLDIRSVDAHVALGEALVKNKDLDEAKREFEVAQVYGPGSAGPVYGQGLILEARGDLKGAIDKYRQAVKLDPNYIEAHKSLALSLAKTGDTAGARAEDEAARSLRSKLSQ